MTDRLLPAAAGEVERRLDDVAAVRNAAVPADLPAGVWDAARVPAEWLPVLAWALSVELWDPDWTDRQKRASIATAASQHAVKGTPAGFRRVLDRLGAVYDYAENVAVAEGGALVPAPFSVVITIHNSASLLLDDQAAVRAQLDQARRASVRYDIRVHEGLRGAIGLAAGFDAAVVAPLLTLRA